MSWTDEEVEDAVQRGMNEDTGQLRIGRLCAIAIMTRAVELVAARGGTMDEEALTRLHRVCGAQKGKHWTNQEVFAVGDVEGLLEHITAQDATVATLRAKVEELEKRKRIDTAHIETIEQEKRSVRSEIEELKKEREGLLARLKLGTIQEQHGTILALRAEVERLNAEAETQRQRAESRAATITNQDAMIAELRAETKTKTDMTLRTTVAESRLAAIREIVFKMQKSPRESVIAATPIEDAYDRGFGDGWVARGARMRFEAEVLESPPLHPTGRCACAGEGSCDWCKAEPA